MNIFGGQGPDSAYIGNNLWSGSGSITPEMARAISFQAKSSGGNQMTNYGIDLTGELFVNPQGFDVPVAFGYEHRQEDGFNFPDAFIAKGYQQVMLTNQFLVGLKLMNYMQRLYIKYIQCLSSQQLQDIQIIQHLVIQQTLN